MTASIARTWAFALVLLLAAGTAGAVSIVDSDGDGVDDTEDNCLLVPNPSQDNQDGQDELVLGRPLVGDKCDLCPTDATNGCELGDVAYEKVVEALGGYGERVDRARDIRPALERAFASGKPACLNVYTNREVGTPMGLMLSQLGGS